MVKAVLALALSFGMVFMPVPDAYADASSDLILKLLVKKGIVTQKEVDELKAEIRAAEEKQPTPEVMAQHVQKAGWVEKFKLKGDVRLRNEYLNPGAATYQNRQRIRARAAIEAKLTDTVKAGIGIASGASGVGSARSTNQTLTDAFSTKPINLDLAYISWKPYKFLKLTGGKHKNPLYRPGDLLWDSDLRFEGATANVKYNLKNDLNIPADLLFNSGGYSLADFANAKKDVYLAVIQGGLGSSVEDYLDWKAFVGYLDFVHIEGTTAAALQPNSATASDNGGYEYDYNILEVSGEMTFHFLEEEFYEPLNKPLTFFADYVDNLAIGDKDDGWEVGVKLGKKPKKLNDWRCVYNFRRLDKDSFPDDFPDADAFRGRTDGFGHEVIFSYGLAKNIWLEFDYYGFRDKTRGTDPNDKWGYIIQTDLNVKF